MLIFTKFVNDVVPTISIHKEKVSDIEIEQFERITKRMEEMAKEIHKKDFAWKEERRQFEQRRIEEAIENSKKMQELKEEIRKERLQFEQKNKEEEERREREASENAEKAEREKAKSDICCIMDNFDVSMIFYCLQLRPYAAMTGAPEPI